MRAATRLRLAPCPSIRLVPLQRHFTQSASNVNDRPSTKNINDVNTTTLRRAEYAGPAGFDVRLHDSSRAAQACRGDKLPDRRRWRQARISEILVQMQQRRAWLTTSQISSKVFPVTGATGGLGLAASIYLAKQGAHVYCLDRSDEPPKQWLEAQEVIAKLGKGELSYMKLDVTDHDAQHEVMAKIADKHQGIDGGYFAAGINCTSDLLDYAPAQAKEVSQLTRSIRMLY